MSKKKNCWEFFSCGREPNGHQVHELGVCPAAIAKNCDGIHGGICGGRACWAIAGTLCNGKLQGSMASKLKNCFRCEFYQEVMRATSDNGNLLNADQIIALNNPEGTFARDNPSGHALTALIKAGDPSLLAHLRQFLGSKIFRVVEAVSMQETIDLAAQTRPDLILLSVTPTDMDGFSVDRTISHLANDKTLPVILITANSSRTLQSQGFKLGALDVLHTEAADFWDQLDREIDHIIRIKLGMKGLCALLVDTNAVSNQAITDCLAQQGVTVLAAKDEAEAKTIVMAQQDIDLVITEASAAEINGIDLCRYLRKLPHFATVPIILLYPEHFRHKVLECIQAGATDYIVKPCPREELLARLIIHIESRQGLKNLHQEVRKNKLLLDCAGEGIIGIDLTGQITFVNQTAARMLGYLPDELQGKNLHGLTHHTSAQGEAVSWLNCPIQQSLEQGSVITISDDIFWRSDNSSLPVKYISAPIISNEAIRGAVVTFSDNTAEKREEDLRRDIEQITRHDLKAPLNGIIGIPALLLDDDNLTARQRGFLEMVRDSGYRMLEMINESLNVFKMEKGTYEFNPVRVDLVPILRSIVEESILMKEKGLTVKITMDGKPCGMGQGFMVRGEKLLCYSMLANLIKNAVEASPEGGAIDIALSHDDRMAELIIHNQGVVPNDIRDRFFDKYSTAGKFGGTGPGTYSAKMIAHTHQGSIDMTSDPKDGTSLIIRLPAWPTTCRQEDLPAAGDDAPLPHPS